jgi:TPR repeat protein
MTRGAEERAIRAYDAACQANISEGCRRAAVLLENGMNVPRDEKRAVEFHLRGCAMGEGNECLWAGLFYLNGGYDGHTIPKDAVQAATIFEEGCRRGDSTSCRQASGLYEKGFGNLKADPQKAREFRKEERRLR